MARIFVLVLLIIGAISLAATMVEGAPQEKRKPNKWEPIIGAKVNGAKISIDKNSLIVNVIDDKNKFTSAELLITYDVPTVVTVGGKKYTIRSMARSMVVECTTGLSAPVFDVFFKEPVPTRESVPVTGIEWPSDVKLTSTILSKGSFLYGTLCPSYI